jgi:hypothetical protein
MMGATTAAFDRELSIERDGVRTAWERASSKEHESNERYYYSAPHGGSGDEILRPSR